MVEHVLKSSYIEYTNEYGKSYEDEEDLVFEDSVELVNRLLSSHDMIRQKVYIIRDFPVFTEESGKNYTEKVKKFKENVFDTIKDTRNRNKYLFILNSDIYSSFSVLNESSQTRSLLKLKNVSVLKMNPYGIRDMKTIINHFT